MQKNSYILPKLYFANHHTYHQQDKRVLVRISRNCSGLQDGERLLLCLIVIFGHAYTSFSFLTLLNIVKWLMFLIFVSERIGQKKEVSVLPTTPPQLTLSFLRTMDVMLWWVTLTVSDVWHCVSLESVRCLKLSFILLR